MSFAFLLAAKFFLMRPLRAILSSVLWIFLIEVAASPDFASKSFSSLRISIFLPLLATRRFSSNRTRFIAPLVLGIKSLFLLKKYEIWDGDNADRMVRVQSAAFRSAGTSNILPIVELFAKQLIKALASFFREIFPARRLISPK
jgi:hypothetical protein